MLRALSTGLRFRLAIAFAAFAALCLVLPPAVLAFGHGENTAHCLSLAGSGQHEPAKSTTDRHQHGDHAGETSHAPISDTSDPAADQAMTCCGLFCLSAVTAEPGNAADGAFHAGHDPAAEPGHLNHLSDRLDRPPIALLFV